MKIEIEIENQGVITAELYPEIAPVTVDNFIGLIEDNFFDGLIFHRVISGFMIQGGGCDADGNPRHAASIKGEFSSNGFKNDLKHERGVISMARTMFPNSASSQFFIMHDDAPHLDGDYAAFGRVIDGMDIVDTIAEAPTGYNDKPVDDWVITTMRIVEE